jgi:hypothetical protein
MEMRVADERRPFGDGQVLVRFRDNEIVEGTAVALDFSRPDFELRAPRSANNRAMLVSLAAVKCVTLERRSLDGWSAEWPLQKVAVHFRDGEVIKGLLGEPPLRRGEGMILTLVSPGRDEVDRLGIPWQAVKGLYFLRTWDSRPVELSRDEEQWTWHRPETPLVDLLGEIQTLRTLQRSGDIDDIEFQRRRRNVLKQI